MSVETSSGESWQTGRLQHALANKSQRSQSRSNASGSTRRSVIRPPRRRLPAHLCSPKCACCRRADRCGKTSSAPASSRHSLRYVPDITVSLHVLEAGFESKGRPCLLLLMAIGDRIYGWRKLMLPLAAAAFHVLAPDMRGYGRTTAGTTRTTPMYFRFATPIWCGMPSGWSRLGHRTAAVVGRDAGSPVAAYCAVIRPDVFRSVAMMTSPFRRHACTAFNTVEGGADEPNDPTTRKHHHGEWRSCRDAQALPSVLHDREANDNMRKLPAGLHAFLRDYYHYKGADWKREQPFRLAALTAEELAKMPTYYIMDLDKGMPETVAEVMRRRRDRRLQWLSEDELAVYTAEYARTGFQGASTAIGAWRRGSPQTCRHSSGRRTTCLRCSSAARAIGVSSRTPAHSRPCRRPPARRCAALTSSMEPFTAGAGAAGTSEQLLIGFLQDASAATGSFDARMLVRSALPCRSRSTERPTAVK